MSTIFQLVYISQAPDDISYSDIQDILSISRRKNAAQNITGLLIFRDGYFLQLLEGNEGVIRLLMDRIGSDDRNHSVQVLIESMGSQRLFEDWSMAFVDGDISANETKDLVRLFEVALAKNNSQSDLIMPMFKVFRASAPALR